jgi:hypothetical protein
MRRAISLLALLLLTPSVFASSNPTAPDWVQQLASQPVGTYPPRTNAVVLLDQRSIFYTGPNEYQEHYRRVVRILRPEGRTEREFMRYFRPGERVLNIHAWSINSAGHVFEIKDKEFLTVSPFGTDELYNDDQAVTAEVAADVGSVVAFECTIAHHPLSTQLSWYFQEDIPVKEARFHLEVPAGWEYKNFWSNTTPEQPTVVRANVWEWVKHDIPGVNNDDEEMSLLPGAIAGKMSLALFIPSSTKLDSWQAIGAWNNQLTTDRRVPTPEIAAKAKELTAGKTGFDPTVRALAAFLQRDIRYVAIEIGIGGQQPHFAADVFRHRYGDCKDKATLLAAMLQTLGIGSHYVLVHTSHGFTAEEMPTDSFNHEILAIDLPAEAPSYRAAITAKNGKHYLIFDPTDEFTALGEIHSGLQGNLALLSLESGGELIRLPLLEPDSNRRERVGKFKLTSDGGLLGEVTEKRNGDSAWTWRSYMKQQNDADRQRYIERYFAYSVKGISIQESKFENLDQINQELISHYHMSSEKYAQNAGGLLLVRPRVLGSLSHAFDFKTRKYAVHLGAPEHEVDTYEIELPTGYSIDDMPDPVQIDVGFASYKSHFENAGTAIRYTREYIVKDPLVRPEKFSDLRRLEDHIGRDEFATVVLQKK